MTNWLGPLAELPQDTWNYWMLWIVIWFVVVMIPPGPKHNDTAYRLNFWHGLLSSGFAFTVLGGYMPENFATMTSMGYMVIDITKNLLNDFYFKTESYQRGNDRRMEYVHHWLCLFIGFYSELYYPSVCSFTGNPVIYFMVAESSTPFLIAWRLYKHDWLGIVFFFVFVAVRIVYQCMFFVPQLMRDCSTTVATVAAWMYIAMNFYFLWTILNKIWRMLTKKKDKNDNVTGIGSEDITGGGCSSELAADVAESILKKKE
jgi:hypothetical protein